MDLILAALFGLLAVEMILFHGLSTLVFPVGVAVGAFFGVFLGRGMIKTIQSAEEFHTTLKTLVYLALIILLIFGQGIVIYLTLGLNAGFLLLGNFLYPVVFSLYLARMIYLLNWERINQKEIVSEGLSGSRFRAVPKH